MSIRWHSQTRTVRIESLKLSGSFKKRLKAPHVLALAASTGEVGRINLPAVAWKVGGTRVLEVAAGEDRIASELVRNGGKYKAGIEVRAFDADDEADVLKVRAHENAHRRHDNRDEWLASLARAQESTEAPVDAEGGAVEAGQPGVAEEATGNPAGEAAPPEALDPPDNVAQGFDDPLPPRIHRALGDELACRAEGVFPPRTVVGVWDLVTCPGCLDEGERQGLYFRSKPQQPVTVAETPKEKAARRREAAKLATEVTGKPVTPAAVKQAEYRDRKAKGQVQARQKHEDGAGPVLGDLGEEVGRGLLDVQRFITDATTRLANLLRKHELLGERYPLDGVLAALKEQGKAVKLTIPEAVCVFCLAAVKKDRKAPCQACHGMRFISKRELGEAPPELRKAAGL